MLTNYLDTCLEIPWKKTTTDRVNIEAARKVLDADHDGLEKVKERILEYMAVKQLSPDLKNQILCLVGPPGVGKTTLASIIAKQTDRHLVRLNGTTAGTRIPRASPRQGGQRPASPPSPSRRGSRS